jgi:hypothetical protein
MVVEDKRRYRRLRLLTKKLNNERKRQAKKMDILCNDLIAAQREFIKRLGAISFEAHFYESIVGTTDLGGLLSFAGGQIKNKIENSHIAFFLRQEDGFELHEDECDGPIGLGKEDIENCFTAELVDNICRSNKICTLDDMFAMGLEGNLVKLNSISAATVPVGRLGSSLGFILIYRPLGKRLTREELMDISSIVPGLSRAIESCRMSLRSTD